MFLVKSVKQQFSFGKTKHEKHTNDNLKISFLSFPSKNSLILHNFRKKKNINETNKNPPRYGRNKSKTLSFSAVHLSGHQGPVI